MQQWIPAVDGAHEKLEAGTRYADIGCGAGHALIKLAQTYPRSSFVGYDSFQGAIEQAQRAAEHARLSDRVRFELLDAADGLPEQYDLISTFDVVHDAIDPVGLLRAIRRALEPDGTYLMLEMRCADDPSDNVGPFGTLLYGISVLYCMTTSLAHGGAGLGTCGCPPKSARTMHRGRVLPRPPTAAREPVQHPLRDHTIISQKGSVEAVAAAPLPLWDAGGRFDYANPEHRA